MWRLDEDVSVAMEKYARIAKLTAELPGLDCGSCGAPSCRALAEDIVRGLAQENDCIFRMRRQIQDIACQLSRMEGYVPGELSSGPETPAEIEKQKDGTA